jgi:outer membrane protein OmpA-like peptidoglycan-associated protein
MPWPALVLLPLLAAVPACTPPPTQELALADMVPRGDGPRPDAPLFTLYFASGSAALTRDAEAILDRLLADPARAGWTRIRLAGHADTSGPARLNRRLSAARVEAVRHRLVAAGVPEAIIDVSVVGERQARSGSAADDRRVEIFVTG